MDTLISKEKLCRDMKKTFGSLDTADKRKMNAVIIAQPAVEKRKTGSWILGDDHMICPACGAKWRYTENETGLFDFCPACGMEAIE